MGLDFKYKTHGQVGDIIYPAYNKTSGIFKKPRWDIITRIDSKGRILDVMCCESYDTIRAIEMMMKLNRITQNKSTANSEDQE